MVNEMDVVKFAWDFITGLDPVSDLKAVINAVYRMSPFMAHQNAEDYLGVWDSLLARLAVDKANNLMKTLTM